MKIRKIYIGFTGCHTECRRIAQAPLIRFRHKGFGGVVLNAAWHEKPEDTEKYLQNEADFAVLDHKIDVCTQKGFGVWLYDEKGYPSGSADGLTLGRPSGI